MVNSGDTLSSLSSEALCEKLKSSGTKILEKVAQIFEEQEIDGEDLTSLTHEELCELLPKLGMRKKLEKFVGKMGFKLVTLPEDDGSGDKAANSDLPALEPSSPKTSASTPSFVLLSDSASPQERKKSRAPKKTNKPKTILDLTGDSESNGMKNNKVLTIRIPKGKVMPSIEDLKKLAAKYHVKFNEMRQTVEAAERLRRSVFISGLPCCTTREGLKTLIDDLKKHIERRTKVRFREIEILVKMFKPTGLVMIKSTKVSETAKVVKSLDGLFLEPEFRVKAKRDSIPALSPLLKNLYNKIKPVMKELYPDLAECTPVRRNQEEFNKRDHARKSNEKMNRVWGQDQGQGRNRTSARPASARPIPTVVSPYRGGYSKGSPYHHLSPRGVTRLDSNTPSRFPRDRLAPRPVVRSHLIQNVRLDGTIDRRAPLVDRRAGPIERRVPPLDRRAPPIDRRAPPIDRRAPPIDRRAPPIDRRDPLVDRRAPLIERRATPVDRRPPGANINQWRSSTITPHNQSGTREAGPWSEPSQGSVRRAYDQGMKSSISNRRSHDVTAVQGRRLPVSPRTVNYGRRPHEAAPSRDLPPPQSFHDRGNPQRAAPQRAGLPRARPLPRRGTDPPFKYNEESNSRQLTDRNSRMPAPRQLGRQQDTRRLPPEQNSRMDQRGARPYVERVNIVPAARGQMNYEQKRIAPALQRRPIYEASQRGPGLRGNEPRGPIPNRQHDQGDRGRGRKRRWEDANPASRESLFITRRNDREGARARY